MGSSIRCGLARPRSLVGGKPTQVAVSHEPGIQPCRCYSHPLFCGLPPVFYKSPRYSFLNSLLAIFPEPVLGNAPRKSTDLGALYMANFSLQKRKAYLRLW
jgi:hypothetical protein